MSYSRWIGSVWYTFWCCTDSDKRDDQIFEICTVKSFTYKQLKDDMDKCIEDLKKDNDATTYREDEYDELKLYMKRFINDVDEAYNNGELK